MNDKRWIFLLVLILVLMSFGQVSYAQAPNQKYFPETGHWVTGNFYAFYLKANDPQLVYGYPITDIFQDSMTGDMVQYFQRARFELHSDAPPELRVQLTPLGKLLYNSGSPLKIPDNFSACRSFPETNFQICYAFLEFFENNGGISQFGYPISNFEIQDERIIQYFQRVRFEWRPELPPGQRVILTDLGSLYFHVRGENSVRLLPPQDSNIPLTILSLQVRAFPQYAVTSLKGDQTISVVVVDQKMVPVSNAQVVMAFQSPSGEQGKYSLPPTNKYGLTQFTFHFTSKQQGIAKIWVLTTYEGLQQKTTTSFRIWW